MYFWTSESVASSLALIDGAQTAPMSVSAHVVISLFIVMIQKNDWFNSINMEKLDKGIRDEIESDRVYEEVCQEVCYDEFYQEHIGKFGEWGTIIDRIDDIMVEQLETIVKSEDNITLVYSVSFSTQTYSDHEFYYNGGEECFIKVVGYMKENRFVIDKAGYMGLAIGFRAFKFD